MVEVRDCSGVLADDHPIEHLTQLRHGQVVLSLKLNSSCSMTTDPGTPVAQYPTDGHDGGRIAHVGTRHRAGRGRVLVARRPARVAAAARPPGVWPGDGGSVV